MVKYKSAKYSWKREKFYSPKERYHLYLNIETSVLIEQLMNRMSTEWGGYLIGSINEEKGYIEIEDIILPRQVVSASECSFCTEDEMKIISEYTTRYLGIIHSHKSMGSFHSSADIDTVDNSLMLDGDRFVSIVLSETNIIANRILAHETITDSYLNNLLQIEFDGMYVKKVVKSHHKHKIEQVMVWEYEEPKQEIIDEVEKRIDKFIEEIEEYKKTVTKDMRIVNLDDVEVLSILSTYYNLMTDIIDMEKRALQPLDILIKLACNFENRDYLMSFLEEIEYFDRTSKSIGFEDYKEVIGRTSNRDYTH